MGSVFEMFPSFVIPLRLYTSQASGVLSLSNVWNKMTVVEAWKGLE